MAAFACASSLRSHLLAVSSLFLLASLSFAQAQTASQVTPRTFAPAQRPAGQGFVIPEGAGPEAPAGAQKISLRLGAVKVEGGLPDMAGATADLVASLSGKKVTVARIFEAARELEAAYAAAGFGLVRVALPAQRLRDGANLRLTVIDGFIETVDVSRLPENIRARIADVLAPIEGQRGLTLAAIERKLLLAGDTPGTVLRSTIGAGASTGGSVLIIEARYKSVTGQLSADNSVSRALGGQAQGSGLEFNSFMGLGESVYLRINGAPFAGSGFADDNPRNRMLAAGVIAPLGADGVTLNLEGAFSRATPIVAAGSNATTSSMKRVSTRLRYSPIRTRDFSLSLDAALDVEEELVTSLSAGKDQSLDRLQVLRPGVDGSWRNPFGGLVMGRLALGLGLGGRGVPGDPAATPLSRQGAGPSFQKLEASLGLNQPVAEYLTLDARLRAQSAFGKPLLRSEQIGLAGAGALSAFDSGLFQGDSGYVARVEAQVPYAWQGVWPFAIPEFPSQQGTGLASEDPRGVVTITPYVFGAVGQTWTFSPTALERARTRGGAYGAGLRLGAAPQASFTNANFGVELARQDRDDGAPRDTRLSLSFNLQF